jgi:hypothetical protein
MTVQTKKIYRMISPINKGVKIVNKVLLSRFHQYIQLCTITNQVSFQRLKFVSLFVNQALYQLK